MKQPNLFAAPNIYGDVQPPAQVPPAQVHSEPSRAAAELIKPRLNDLQQAILAYLRKCEDGATDEEMQDAIPLTPSTQRPRRVECCDMGLVRDSGRTRKTRSGRAATVWVAC